METNNVIIAHSSALVSLTIKSDRNHAAAVKLIQQIAADNRSVIIPCDVFAETVNILGKKFGHSHALEAIDILLHGAVFVVEDIGKGIRADALAWFRDVADGVSYTDCIVMAVANASKTKQVFGFDDVFSKLGYQLPEKQAA